MKTETEKAMTGTESSLVVEDSGAFVRPAVAVREEDLRSENIDLDRTQQLE